MKRLARKPWAPLIMVSLMAMLLSVLAAGWANERRDRLEQVASLQEQLESNNAMCQASIYGLRYSLSSEQAKAGSFEAQRDYIEKALGNNKGYVDNLLSRIASLELMLEQCHATNRMLSDGWTGNAAIKPGE